MERNCYIRYVFAAQKGLALNIFISFAKEDKSKVSRLEGIVRHGGVQSWQFVYDLHGARDWQAEIQYKIDSCDAFLFVITEDSLQSDWCLKELQHAALTQKPIVTVVFTPDINVPYPLSTIQFVLFDESPESGAKLVRALIDPSPLSSDKIPSNWQLLGGGPLGVRMTQYKAIQDIPIPRLKRELTDMEKEDFLYEAIQEIRDYFSRALQSFQNSDERVSTRLRASSDSDFRCQVYIDGNLRKVCRLWVNGNLGFNGIAYSEGRGNSALHGELSGINELASVTVLDGKPALELSLFSIMYSNEEAGKICTAVQAAERLWKRFTEEFNQVS